MRPTHWLMTAIIGLLFTGCVGINTVPAPEARQALAPTGKLRVGLQLGSPHNVIRDAVSGEMKGVGYDLGKELARRLGVAFVTAFLVILRYGFRCARSNRCVDWFVVGG